MRAAKQYRALPWRKMARAGMGLAWGTSCWIAAAQNAVVPTELARLGPLAGSATGAVQASESDSSDPKRMLREGTEIDSQMGRFQHAGDSAVFVTRDGLELVGLPNLNLQRVLRTLKSVDAPESLWWSVSGEVTEFGDRNYLLISRAVFKAAAAPPPPQQLPAVGDAAQANPTP